MKEAAILIGCTAIGVTIGIVLGKLATNALKIA